jgi:hypothetical protein
MTKGSCVKRSSGSPLVVATAVAMLVFACASQNSSAPQAVAGVPSRDATCNIDARKMCAAIDKGPGGNTAASAPPLSQSYGTATMPDSLDFQIPAGPEVRLMCYFDPQHLTIARADATPKTPLDANAVKYLKEQGFCVSNP